MFSRIENRTAFDAKTWARCHIGMEPALRGIVKLNRIKGVRFSKDCGELLVNYLLPHNKDIIVDTIFEMQRVRTK